MEQIGRPKPLFGDVLIENPLNSDTIKSIEEHANKLPEKDRQAFLEEKMSKMWGNVEILAVGEDCRALSPGDIVIGSSNSVTNAMPTPDGKYLFVPERSFRGKW